MHRMGRKKDGVNVIGDSPTRQRSKHQRQTVRAREQVALSGLDWLDSSLQRLVRGAMDCHYFYGVLSRCRRNTRHEIGPTSVSRQVLPLFVPRTGNCGGRSGPGEAPDARWNISSRYRHGVFLSSSLLSHPLTPSPPSYVVRQIGPPMCAA
jgi:hypothetical protein